MAVPLGGTPKPPAASSSLLAPEVARTLDRLHRRARADLLRIALVAPLVVPDFFGLRKVDDARLSRRMRRTYLPVSRSQGRMLYLVARSIDARRIVEFGTSFGISTIYLAAAVKDNGGGVVVGSELDPSKHAKAGEHLREAGLDGLRRRAARGRARRRSRTSRRRSTWCSSTGGRTGTCPSSSCSRRSSGRGRSSSPTTSSRSRERCARTSSTCRAGRNGFVSATLEISDGFELSVFTG